MEKILDLMMREWRIITSAPYSILAAILFVTAVTQRVWKWYYRKRLADKDATIELLREQLKLNEASHQAEHINQELEEIYKKILEELLRK